MTETHNNERRARGLAMVEALYGPGSSTAMAKMAKEPLVTETIDHMFGEIWSRPLMSTRDKRLLVIGATTMLGRSDLLEVQIAGALFNGELSEAELGEIALLMLFYAGAGNSTGLHRAIAAAKVRTQSMKGAVAG